MSESVREILAEFATQPAADWPALLQARFPDDAAMIAQCLLWLRAEADHGNDDDAPPRPASVDRYRLEVRLGRGGSAAVWRAYDEKLGREVALKMFHGGASSSAMVEALTEARAACDVVSDHVVRVLDVHDDGAQPFIVMELVGEHDVARDELVPGESAATCRPGSIDEAVRWSRDVARGVQDAHLRNVFHRDLKPHNVLITPVSRRARIADFGLAVSAAGDVAAVALMRGSPSGAVRIAGTPAYMAPEQARGLPIDLDPRNADERARLVSVDVWGLGALAYDLLGGGPPWRARDGAEAWEIAASGQRATPLRRASTGARIPRRLRRVVEKAMAIDPRARYRTAGELAAELDAFLASRPTSLDRSRMLRALLWSRRSPQLTISVLVALALAVGTLSAYQTVASLRDQRRTLSAEMADQEADNAALQHRITNVRRELGTTEGKLRDDGAALASLRSALADEKREYQDVVDAKEKALRDADLATRTLLGELAQARSERDAAQFGRTLYESYWSTARSEAERAGKERDAAAAAAASADKERAAALDARAAAQQERDQARADRDQAVKDRARADADVARLSSQAAASAAQISELERRIADARAATATTKPVVDGGAAATVVDGGAEPVAGPPVLDGGAPVARAPVLDGGEATAHTPH